MLDLPEGGAQFLVWSPDGNKLATAGNDETLSIWNFITSFKKKSSDNKKYSIKTTFKNCKSKILLDSGFGSQFEMWSSIK